MKWITVETTFGEFGIGVDDEEVIIIRAHFILKEYEGKRLDEMLRKTGGWIVSK